MKKPAQHLIAEVPRRQSRVEMTIGIDLGDVWSHYCTLNEEGEVVEQGRFRTTPKGVEKWFTDLPPARVAMEAGTHSIWIREQLQELGHEIIVANVRELRAISQQEQKQKPCERKNQKQTLTPVTCSKHIGSGADPQCGRLGRKTLDCRITLVQPEGLNR